MTMTIHLILKTNNLKTFAQLAFLVGVCWMGYIKATFIFLRRYQLGHLIKQLNLEIFQPINDIERKILTKGFRFYDLIRKFLVTEAWISVAATCITPLFYNKNGGFVVAGWYPFNTSVSPTYELVYTQQSVSMIYVSMVNIYVDVVLAGILTFIGVQCDFVCHRLKNSQPKHKIKSVMEFEKVVNHHRLVLK